jgi:hypothetical protein
MAAQSGQSRFFMRGSFFWSGGEREVGKKLRHGKVELDKPRTG